MIKILIISSEKIELNEIINYYKLDIINYNNNKLSITSLNVCI